jgi:hypothetical protein
VQQGDEEGVLIQASVYGNAVRLLRGTVPVIAQDAFALAGYGEVHMVGMQVFQYRIIRVWW